MGALRELLANFGFNIESDKLIDADKKLNSFADNAAKLADKLAGGSIAGAFKAWTDDVKEASGQFKGLAKQTGVGAQEMQTWTTAATLSGGSAEALGLAMKTLQKNQASAAGGLTGFTGDLEDFGEAGGAAGAGGKKATDAFKALGVDIRDAQGNLKTTPQLLGDVGLELAKIKDPALRSAATFKVLGRGATQLNGLFDKGEAGLAEYLGQLEALGGGVSDDALKALGEQSKATKRYDIATLSLKSAIVAELLPAATKKIEALTKLVLWFDKAQKGTQIVKVATTLLAGAFLYAQRAAISSAIKTAIAWAPTIIAFTLLALLIDDVLTAFKGGDSVIGKFLDHLLGVGAGKVIFGEMGKDVDALGKKLDETPGWIDKIGTVLTTIGGSIGKFFTDDLPEVWEFFWKNLNDEAGHKGTTFTDFVREMFGNLWKWASTAASEAGQSILDGLIGGLSSKWDALKEAVKRVASTIKNEFEEFFGINSPSTVMADESGFLLQGAEGGFERGIPALKASAQKAWDVLMPDPSAYAPQVRLPSFSSADGPGTVTKRVEIRSETKQYFQGDTPDSFRDAARSGANAAHSDERGAMLASLESEG